jgi:hypothetical protein
MLTVTDRTKKDEKGKNLHQQEFDIWDMTSKLSDEVANEAENRGLYLDIVVNPDVPRFFIGNFCQLKEIFLKLVNFSMESTKTGGITVLIKTSYLFDNDKQYLEIIITDTGLGLLSEKLQSVLQSKYLLNSKYYLNMKDHPLYNVKMLTQEMEGDLRVHSTYGRGTRYTATCQLQAPTGINSIWEWNC